MFPSWSDCWMFSEMFANRWTRRKPFGYPWGCLEPKSTSRHVDPLEVLLEFWGHDDVLPMGTSQWGEGRLTDVATDPGTSAFQERLPHTFQGLRWFEDDLGTLLVYKFLETSITFAFVGLTLIEVTATHVRLRLPTKTKGDVAEELLIDLQTSQACCLNDVRCQKCWKIKVLVLV